jgi:retron-type reverse transcriptase
MGDQPGDREESSMTCKSYDIPKTLIWEAWLRVKANQGAAGVDAETIERFETKLATNLYKLWNRMSSGSYFPPPVKAVPIPKKSGGMRVLGVPTVSDRIAQTAVKMWLEPRLDPLFHDDMAIGRGNRRWRRSLSPDAVVGIKTGWWSSTSGGCSTISITVS